MRSRTNVISVGRNHTVSMPPEPLRSVDSDRLGPRPLIDGIGPDNILAGNGDDNISGGPDGDISTAAPVATRRRRPFARAARVVSVTVRGVDV